MAEHIWLGALNGVTIILVVGSCSKLAHANCNPDRIAGFG